MTHKQVLETMPSNALGVWALNLLKAAASQREPKKLTPGTRARPRPSPTRKCSIN